LASAIQEATLAVKTGPLLFSAISGDQFLDWGWRVPFWISIVMIAIGLWIRLGILETPSSPADLSTSKVKARWRAFCYIAYRAG
jgi:MFS family permease